MKWFLAVCSLVFLTALVTPPKVTSERSPETPKTPDPVIELPNKALIDQWFSLIEGALTDLSTTRGRWENQLQSDGTTKRVFVEPGFGMSRLPMIQGHGLVRDAASMGDTRQVREILRGSNLEIAILGFGNGTSPMSQENFEQKYFAWNKHQLKPEITTKFIKDSYASIVKGTPAFKRLGDWEVQSRLVRLNKKECLNCHTENKLNDPVAIFAFATRPAKESTQDTAH